jgi:dTDP-4-amino-4,6-dideoxygalactose transaminase
MRATFLPFSIPTIGEEEINEVVDSLKSGWITTGPKVKRFEEAFKRYVQAPYCVPLSSATAGLHLSMLALKLHPGDEVITTPMTFAATVSMIVQGGGTPVLADIEPGTLNIDVQAIRGKITPRTRAIVPVHFAGHPCAMDEIFALAREFGLKVIEDAAHAVGTQYKGSPIGSLDSTSVFSFHPIKNITTGEGGMVATGDEELAEELSLMKFHGMNKEAWKRYEASGTPNYDIVMPGFKYNMMDLQAALGLHQLEKLDDFIEKRTILAKFYNEAFSDVAEVATPEAVPYQHRHAWHLYTPLIRTEALTIDRDGLMEQLKKENIGTGLHFKAIHHHPYFRDLLGIAKGALPNADYASDRILSLPLFPLMTQGDAQDVVAAVKKIIARNKR